MGYWKIEEIFLKIFFIPIRTREMLNTAKNFNFPMFKIRKILKYHIFTENTRLKHKISISSFLDLKTSDCKSGSKIVDIFITI